MTCKTTFKEGLLGISNTCFWLAVLHLENPRGILEYHCTGLGREPVTEEDAPSPTQDMALPAPGMSEWTVKPWRKLLSCRCLNVVESSPKTGQRVEGGLLALAAGHHTQREQATKNAPSSACLPSGNGGRTDRGRKYGQDCCQAGWHSRLWPLLCCRWCRDHSYCGCHYQGPSTIHLQLLSDRNFGRTLQLGHCILPPASCFTFAT